MDKPTLLSQRLNEYKNKNTVSWEEMAVHLGVARRTIARWVNDNDIPRSTSALVMLVSHGVLSKDDAKKLKQEWRTRAGMFYPKKGGDKE